MPGTASRLRVYAIRTVYMDDDGWAYDRRYEMRDAGRISDAEVRAGKRPPVIGRWDTLDEVEAAVEKARQKHPEVFAFQDVNS